ncbi:hypothetical protein BCR37DRAFT_379840 [Protomyces lactucae-debilis]|uniref:Signal recognition particle subunit SRP68 n=1 Tax=Protomyces lactucae-debilis TaxID=2754530 RepID=A0A1Y2FF61_PROLT|nr:uncharacterized protein BCR37DRAFT_379840 [Protomyces lactucae-debilis]ORY81936.1 hypothetical protein BCR37DRAFT_379840 [Protomyces lactucae-debilis]
MSLLQLVEFERDEYCRFEDYGRYHKHLTRKLHTLRKGSTTSKTKTKVTSGPAWLLPVLSAERVWSAAMETKTAAGPHQVVLAKFRKAIKFAATTTTETNNVSALEKLERAVYVDYLTALLQQERSNLDLAIHFYARALVGLQVYNTAQQRQKNNAAVALTEAVETGLRYVLYTSQTVSERSLNLHAFAIEQVTTAVTEDAQADQTWRQLILSVDSEALTPTGTATCGDGTNDTSDTLVSQISWAGRTATLKQSHLAASISTALSGRATASRSRDSTDALDTVIAAWTSTLETLQPLLDAEEDQDAAQDLELIKAYAQFESGQDYLARDKRLITTLPAREGILVLDQTIARLTQAAGLPGVSKEQASLVSLQQTSAKAERCVLLSDVHGVSLAGIALLNKAITYLTNNRQDGNSDPHVTSEQQTQGSRLQALQQRLHRHIAEHTLALSGDAATDSGTVLDPAAWYTGTAKQLAKTDAKSLVAKSAGAKPIVLDIAWNYLSGAVEAGDATIQSTTAVRKEEPMEVDGAAAESEEQSTPGKSAKKGLFGSIFGR